MMSKKYFIQFVLAFLFMTELHAQQQLSLQDAISLARAHNAQLKQSALDVKKASSQKVIARSLFLPSVYAGAQVNHYFQLPAFFGFGENSEGGRIPYGRLGGEDQLAATVTAVQPLYNPLAGPINRLADLQQQESALAARDAEVDVLSQVEDTYFRILVLQERARLTEESIDRNQKVLRDSRMLFIQGKGLRVDTLRAYTSVRNLEPELVKLKYAIETAKLELRSLIGVDSLEEFVLVDSLMIPVADPIPAEQSVFEEVISSNPDFQLLKVRAEFEKQSVRAAAAYGKPSLSIVGQYQVLSHTRKFDYDNAHFPTSSFAGLQLSVPLFTGLSTQARVRQAALTKNQTDLEVEYQRERLRARVHEVIAEDKEAFLRLETTAVVQETAQLSYDIIQYRYKNGIASRLELTDAELALSTAESNYLEAVYDYLSARIALRKLMGR